MGRSRKDKDKELFPWENQKQEGKAQRATGIPPRTSLRAKIRSKPKGAGQEYLDMYLLTKEKDRLEKYGKSLAKSQEITADSWREMDEEMKKMDASLPEQAQGDKAQKSKRKKAPEKLPRDLKTINWTY